MWLLYQFELNFDYLQYGDRLLNIICFGRKYFPFLSKITVIPRAFYPTRIGIGDLCSIYSNNTIVDNYPEREYNRGFSSIYSNNNLVGNYPEREYNQGWYRGALFYINNNNRYYWANSRLERNFIPRVVSKHHLLTLDH